ncbi:MAG: class I SAM-dependent methyltransferase [Defluviitaleaceae bacterium]|nr:class I SAM-dependent methyltransferase [Defluviitaleaceae bacterium]
MGASIYKKSGKIWHNAKLSCIKGGGQGRDAMYFAQRGFDIHVLDYSDTAIGPIEEKARLMGLWQRITTLKHDARDGLPFDDQAFDACFSHMFFCMALTLRQLESISGEILRVLKPNGINIFTTRNTHDAHFGAGIHRGDGMYEMNGFVVHFLGIQQINRISKGFEGINIEEFEEGELPKKLYCATMHKK